MEKIGNEVKPKKESKLSIDSDFDFIFLKKWPPALRWLFLIPVFILTLLVMQGIFGFFANKLYEVSGNSEIVLYVVNVLVTLIKHVIIIIALTATVPMKNKLNASFTASILPLALLAFVVVGFYTASNTKGGAITPAFIWSGTAAAILGIAKGIYDIKNALNKAQEGATAEE